MDTSRSRRRLPGFLPPSTLADVLADEVRRGRVKVVEGGRWALTAADALGHGAHRQVDRQWRGVAEAGDDGQGIFHLNVGVAGTGYSVICGLGGYHSAPVVIR